MEDIIRRHKDLYEGLDLESKQTSYRQWVEVLKTYTEKNKAELNYWQEIQSDQEDHERLAKELIKNEVQFTEIELEKA